MLRTRYGVLAVALGMMALMVGCAPTTPPGGWAAAGCYDSPVADAPDLRFNGAPNVVGNLTVSLDIATFALATNGSCSGVPLGAPYTLTLVKADSQELAEAACGTLGLDDGVGQAQSEYPGLPADAWICNPPEPV